MEIPANLGDDKRFGFSDLIESGLKPEIWDLSRIYFPHVTTIPFTPPENIESRLIEELSSLKSLVSRLDDQDTVVLIGASTESKIWRWRKYLEIVFESRARIAALAFGAIPELGHEPESQKWSINLMRRVGVLRSNPTIIKDWGLRLWERVLVKADLVRSQLLPRWELDYIWAAIDANEISPLLVGSRTKIRYIHELDYDQVLRESSWPLDECDYIVFLGFGGQDSDLLRVKNHIRPEERAAKVSKFFDQIESVTGLPVVIASHPRTTKGVLEPFTGDRSTYYHETARLVSQARLVLTSNQTTAVSMAVAFRRPMLMISSLEFDSNHEQVCRMMMRRLGVSTLDPEDSLDQFEWPEVDEILYSAYFDEYVKRPGTPQIPFWRSVAQDIHDDNLIRNRPN